MYKMIYIFLLLTTMQTFSVERFTNLLVSPVGCILAHNNLQIPANILGHAKLTLALGLLMGGYSISKKYDYKALYNWLSNKKALTLKGTFFKALSQSPQCIALFGSNLSARKSMQPPASK